MTHWKKPGRVLAALVATVTAAHPAMAYTIRCESRDHRYTYCRADISGPVRVERELSDTNCRRGDNWGYDGRGVWVDRGCRAEFNIEEGRRYGDRDRYDHRYDDRYYDDRRDHDDDHHHKHDDGAKVAAGVAGAVILGALIAGAAQGHAGDHVEPPSWMIGRFRGYNPRFDADVALTVSPDGTVDGYVGDQRLSGVYTREQQIAFGATRFDIRREGSGFGTVEVGNQGNHVHYDRLQ